MNGTALVLIPCSLRGGTRTALTTARNSAVVGNQVAVLEALRHHAQRDVPSWLSVSLSRMLWRPANSLTYRAGALG